jgi:hypothetical protein
VKNRPTGSSAEDRAAGEDLSADGGGSTITRQFRGTLECPEQVEQHQNGPEGRITDRQLGGSKPV